MSTTFSPMRRDDEKPREMGSSGAIWAQFRRRSPASSSGRSGPEAIRPVEVGERPGLGRRPSEFGAGARARGEEADRDEMREPAAEMLGRLLRRFADDRQAEAAADRRGDTRAATNSASRRAPWRPERRRAFRGRTQKERESPPRALPFRVRRSASCRRRRRSVRCGDDFGSPAKRCAGACAARSRVRQRWRLCALRPARSNFVPSLFLTRAAHFEANHWHAACSLVGAPSVLSRFGTPDGGRPP